MVLNSYKYGYQGQWKCTRQLTTINNKLANLAVHGYGIGRTWQIFVRICLPCGRNLSSVGIAKCDPEFSS